MRNNQSLIDLIGWLLMASAIIGLVMLFTSCATPRLAAPSADDLSGAPIVHKITIPK